MNSATISTGSHQASEALGLWEPTRTLTLEAARRHSARIKLMRQFLMAAAGLVVVMLIWQFMSRQGTVFPEDNPNESVKMVNPRYSGRTSDGLPYKLTAAFATREIHNAEEVKLDNPVLEFYREQGADISRIKADSGRYDDVNKVLNLRQAVNLKTDDGYDCATTHARIFAREKRIEGDERIECTGSFGAVNGNSYEIIEDYTVFVFKDGMDALLENDVTTNAVSAPIQEDTP